METHYCAFGTQNEYCLRMNILMCCSLAFMDANTCVTDAHSLIGFADLNVNNFHAKILHIF